MDKCVLMDIDCVNKARLFVNSILLVDTLITRTTCQYRYRIELESLDKSKLLASTRKKKAKKHLGRIILACNFEILENQSLRSYHMFVEWGISFLLEKTNLGRRKKKVQGIEASRKSDPKFSIPYIDVSGKNTWIIMILSNTTLLEIYS